MISEGSLLEAVSLRIVEPERASVSGNLLLRRLLILSTSLVVAIHAFPILSFPPGRDQGEYLQLGQSLLDGKHLYVQLWDNKPVGIFYVYSAIAKVFGRVMWSVAVVDILLLLAISYLLFRFTERYLGVVGASIAVIFHSAWHGGMLYFWIAQPETFQVLATLGAALVLMRDDNWRARCFVAGLVCGFGFWLKYNFVAFFPLVFLLPYLDESALAQSPPRFALRLKWNEWVTRAAFICSGLVLTIVAVMARILFTGAWPAMRESQFQVLPCYAKMAITNDPHYLSTAIVRTYSALGLATLLVALAAIILGWITRDFKRLLPLLFATGVALGATVMQVRFHSYYFQVCFPFFAALWAYLAVKLYEATRILASLLKKKIGRVAAALAWILFANCMFWPLPPLATGLFLRYEDLIQWSGNRELFYANCFQLPMELLHGQLQVVHYVERNTKADDSIYVWGSNSLIYFLTAKQPPTRFVLNLGVMAKWGKASWKDEIMQQLEASTPRLIVITKHDALPTITYVDMDSEQYLHREFPRLDNFVTQNYRRATEFDGFVIYQRK